MKQRIYILITLLVLLTLACGSGSKSASKSADAPAKVYKIGEDVPVGKVRWKVTEVKDEGKELKSSISTKTTGGKFLRVSFEIENLDKDMKSFTGLELVDGQGRKFKRYSDGIPFIENDIQCILENLNPNVPKKCQTLYELPADAAGLMANVGDLSLFGGDEAMIALQ